MVIAEIAIVASGFPPVDLLGNSVVVSYKLAQAYHRNQGAHTSIPEFTFQPLLPFWVLAFVAEWVGKASVPKSG